MTGNQGAGTAPPTCDDCCTGNGCDCEPSLIASLREPEMDAERDGYADGKENVTWRAQRHPVERRVDYGRGFQRGQAVYHRGHPRMGDHAKNCPAWGGGVCRCGVHP